MTQPSLVSRNIIAASGRLKLEFWAALQDICRREQVSLATLVQRVEGVRVPGIRASAVRVFALWYDCPNPT